jgi:hypothetical protein
MVVHWHVTCLFFLGFQLCEVSFSECEVSFLECAENIVLGFSYSMISVIQSTKGLKKIQCLAFSQEQTSAYIDFEKLQDAISVLCVDLERSNG